MSRVQSLQPKSFVAWPGPGIRDGVQIAAPGHNQSPGLTFRQTERREARDARDGFEEITLT